MRTIQVEEITKEVEQMCKEAAYYLPQDIYEALKKGRETEESPVGQVVLDQIIKNSEIARAEDRPICQDTGMTIIFLEVGQDVHFEGGDLTEAINKGVANGYVNGYLRKSVVAEPLFDRKNTQNNTPAIIYTKIVPGDQLKIELTCKGFGSENKGGIKMLVPADGVEGVKKAVLDIIQHASCNPCPPMVVGVGIGGDFEKCAIMAKQALTRNLNDRSEIPYVKEMEEELLQKINGLGIGPGGLGGTTTALAVNINTYPTHIAGLPVAINICCHVDRHVTEVI